MIKINKRFSRRSANNLKDCHPLLILLFNEVVQIHDCSIVKGHRGKKEQDEAFYSGKSKLRYPLSKHNKLPSLAVDVQPYPYKKGDLKTFLFFSGVVYGVSKRLGIDARWGGDWNKNLDLHDQSFNDLFHWELSI